MSYSSFETSNEADFQKLAQTIGTSIRKILQNVSSMQRMTNQLGTAQDNPELKQQLHQIRIYTQQLVKDTGNLLNDLTSCKERHLKIQRDRLVDEFAAALTAFQTVQRKFVDLEKHAVRQAYENKNIAINKPPPTSKGGSNNSGNAFVDPFEDSFVSQTQTQMQDDLELQQLEEQERSIRELEENIVSVNEIYKKLGALVYEQGNTVDSIEASVEQTSVFVQQGAEQLRKAGQYRNKVRRKKVMFVLVAIAILAILFMIIYISN
ncbi:syntaxin-7 [Culicoides brevitarsis]|uniref:syntaxin-7 n=1 Tax=Culicoides brevitarsis TaxID=469753 RepID=UPI00307B411F